MVKKQVNKIFFSVEFEPELATHKSEIGTKPTQCFCNIFDDSHFELSFGMGVG